MGSVYESKRWRHLEPKERAYILPTLEDIRPGSYVTVYHSVKPDLEYCLSEKGAKYGEDKEGQIIIAKDEKLLEEILLVVNKFKENKGYYHNTLGKKLFGYPECCVDQFIRTLIPDDNQPGTEWKKKAREAMEKGVFDELFYYTLHVPCKLDCQESLRMAKEIKRVLELNDYEAAKYLREFKMEVLGK